LDKILQDAGVKLSSVASDILGVSGRAMLAGLVSGTTDAEVLADLALGQMRHKIPALRAALTSRFSTHHAVIVSAILAKLEFLDELIAGLTTEIEVVIGPFSHQVELLDTIPGVSLRTAQGLLAEIGADMAVFNTASRLASWAGVCPGHHESAGRARSGKTRKARNGWGSTCTTRPWPPSAPRTPTWAPSTTACGRGLATPKHSSRWNTASSWRSSTCSTVTSPTTIWAPTTSPAATTPPDAPAA